MLVAPGFTVANQSTPAKAVNVATAKVQQMPNPTVLTSFGNLVAINAVTIASEVSGKVEKIFFKDGQSVKKGVPILQIDNTQAEADLASAKADLDLSERNYQRYQALSKLGGATSQQLDKAKADMNAKKTAVQNKILLLQKYTIVAPFDGTLGSFAINPGDYVAPGDKLVTIVNNHPLKVKYSLPQNDLTLLKLGQTVVVSVGALPHKTFIGTVTYIAPSIDANTGTVAVQGTLPNKQRLLSPGMFANVKQFAGGKLALFVPEESVMASLQGPFVFKLVNNRAIKAPVTVGNHLHGYVNIIKGLTLKDSVIIQGQQKLTNNQLVNITDVHTPEKTSTTTPQKKSPNTIAPS